MSSENLHAPRERLSQKTLLEWIRRGDSDFERFLKTYLFTEGPILQEEQAATGEAAQRGTEIDRSIDRSDGKPGFTIGSLRDR